MQSCRWCKELPLQNAWLGEYSDNINYVDLGYIIAQDKRVCILGLCDNQTYGSFTNVSADSEGRQWITGILYTDQLYLTLTLKSSIKH